MAKIKLNSLKRFIFVYLTQCLLTLNANDKYLFLTLIYAQLITITMVLGVWNFFDVTWHILIVLLYTVTLIILISQFIKNIKYYNKQKALFWIESKNFKLITPLTTLHDHPSNSNYNKNIWYLHKINAKKNLKNLNFILPSISLRNYDPLNLRYLLFLFLFLSIFWSYKNNKLYDNILGWTNFSTYINEDNYFDLKVWYRPPDYTKLREKLIPIPKEKESIRIQEYIPINSEFKVFVKSNSKNFSIVEDSKALDLKKINKDNYELSIFLEKNKNIIVNYEDKEFIVFDLEVIKDKKPKIQIISAPAIVNESSLSFISKVTDDYGIKSVFLNINRPLVFKHFQEEFISHNLFLNKIKQNNNNPVENYFHKYLADIVWAGSNTYLEIKALDYINQATIFSSQINIPKKKFKNEIANELLNIREKLAKNHMNKSEGKYKLTNIFNINQHLLNDENVKNVYLEIINLLSFSDNIKFSVSNNLFKKLYSLAELIEEGEFYIARKNLEQVEQNLFDSVKQHDTEKVSTNFKKLKEKINSLLDLDNKNKSINNPNSESIKDQIEELAKQIEDLLKTGTKEGVKEKMQKLKQLSESIKNPYSNKKAEEKLRQKQEFINKLSELLNEQEKVMEETFNRAAERGKFEQSSEGSGGKSPKEKQEKLRNTLGNVIREIGASENEIPQDLGRADRAMRQASRDLENGRPDEASNAQARAVEMIQRAINKIDLKENMSKMPKIADKGKETKDNKEKEYLADNQNIEYQGTSAGGTINLPGKRRIKNASKIAEELYSRYNEEDRSLKDKKHIKNLLDWY